jgi:hypothetical protein
MEWDTFNNEAADWTEDEIKRPVARDVGRRKVLGRNLKELAARWPLLFAALCEVAAYSVQ